MTVNQSENTFKDVVILVSDEQQIAENWNWAWKTTNIMSHTPGIRIEDVDHWVFSKTSTPPDVVILSQERGDSGKRDNKDPGILEITPGLEEYIRSKGVSEVYILKTVHAINKYNEIRKEGKSKLQSLLTQLTKKT